MLLVGRLHRRRRLLPGRVLRPAAHVAARHDGHGVARDLISIFVALETISIPTFVLAGWRKHDPKSNEAAIKYYLIGVLSSAVMLYGMSLVFGLTGVDAAERHLPDKVGPRWITPLLLVAGFLTIVGFAFKVSAVPFHFWAPDTYEGAPTPVTAFLSVASKAGGFVALLSVVLFGFFPNAGHVAAGHLGPRRRVDDPRQPGRAAARRTSSACSRTRRSRRAGSSSCRFAVAPDGGAARSSIEAVVIYILIYGAMNLGAFAIVIARRPPHPLGRDHQLRRPRPVRAGHGAADVDLPVLARRRPAVRGLVREVHDVPRRARREHAGRHRARRDRRGQLGDRVLLLRHGSPARCGSTRSPRASTRRRCGRRSRSTPRSAICADRRARRSACTRSSSPASASEPRRRQRLSIDDRRRLAMNAAAPALVERIHRNGPVRFGTFVELALYGRGGFFTEGGGAGRAGRDFVTSPEVGSLFGACVARALDRRMGPAGASGPVRGGGGRCAATVVSPRRAPGGAAVRGGAPLRPRRAQRRAAAPSSWRC